MLPPVVQGVVEQIGRKAENTVVAGAANELERRYRQDDVCAECNQAITGRYPFTPNSSNDLPLSDFGRLFDHGGVFDKFFNENLDALVDRSQSPWTWRSGAPQGTRVILDHVREGDADPRHLFPAGHLGARAQVPGDRRGGRLVVHSISSGNRRPGHRVSAADAHGRRQLAWSESRDGRGHVVRDDTAVSPGWPSSDPGPGSACSTPRVRSRKLIYARGSSSSTEDTAHGSSSKPRPFGIRSRIGIGSISAARFDAGGSLEVGLYGKLPSHGDFLRRRTSDAFVSVWDAWLQDCLASSRSALGDRWLDVYLTSPAWRFAWRRGCVRTVARDRLDGAERRSRRPLLSADARRRAAAVRPAWSPPPRGPRPSSTAAERLVIETLEAEYVDFEDFDQQVGASRGRAGLRRRTAVRRARSRRGGSPERRLAGLLAVADRLGRGPRAGVRAASVAPPRRHLRSPAGVVDRRVLDRRAELPDRQGPAAARHVRGAARRLVAAASLAAGSGADRDGDARGRSARRRSRASAFDPPGPATSGGCARSTRIRSSNGPRSGCGSWQTGSAATATASMASRMVCDALRRLRAGLQLRRHDRGRPIPDAGSQRPAPAHVVAVASCGPQRQHRRGPASSAASGWPSCGPATAGIPLARRPAGAVDARSQPVRIGEPRGPMTRTR